MASDEELAQAFRDGDDAAFGALYERHRRSLYAFGLRMLGDAEAARDLVQDTFLGLYERRRDLAGLRSFRAWLFTVGRNRCLTWLRQRKTRERLIAGADPEPPREGPGAGLESEERSRLVRQVLAAMPPEQREVLVLREYQELSYREIAEITGTSESAVKSRLFRARQSLAGTLGPAWRGEQSHDV
jgi:RNA polymerase sigma-70 factor, ECF subfamily